MNAQQKKALKRKEREKKSKAKVAKIREELRNSRKETLQKHLLQKEADQIVHGKQQPFIRDPLKKAQREAMMADKARNQLEKNMDILKALEAEYEQAQAIRIEMNEKLENEGHKTLKQKMDALHEKALKLEGKVEKLAEAKQQYAEELAENADK